LDRSDDKRWMREAILEAEKAAERGEVPVGAVVVSEGIILGRGHNMVEELGDPTAHAEIIAIGAASRTIGTWRLDGAALYTSLEPCIMCAGAIDACRLERLVYAAGDSRKGAFGSAMDIRKGETFCRGLVVDYGIMVEEASRLLERFFRAKRLLKSAAKRDCRSGESLLQKDGASGIARHVGNDSQHQA